MAEMSLQFQGAGQQGQVLLTVLVTAVALILAVHGFLLLIGRRWRPAAARLAAALAAVLVWAGMVLLGVAGGGPAMFVLTAVVIAAAAACYAPVREHLGPARLAMLLALRAGAVLVLMLMLFKPALSFTPRSDAGRALLPILVDRSASMATADLARLPDRYRQSVQMLASQRQRIDRHFRPVWFHFAESAVAVESLDQLGKLAPVGEGTDGTNLALAIRSAADRDRARLVGLLVVSDGIHNAPDDVLAAAAEAGVAIYTVAVGSQKEDYAQRVNVELLSADCPMAAVKNNVTTITCRAKLTGLAGSPAKLELLAADSDQPLDSAELVTNRNSETLTARLRWTPKASDVPEGSADVRRLRLSIAAGAAEVVADDNAAELHVLVTDPQIRLLYVAGTIRPEYKFLRRLLETDRNVDLLSLVRVTARRFVAQGSPAGRRLDALPSRPEDFELFDVIILDDLDSSFLTPAQQGQLKRFVDAGGGLAMLGGQNSFGPGGYGGTDVEQVLPVVTGPRSQPQDAARLLPQLTAAGRRHPIFDGIGGYFPGPGGRQAEPGRARLPELLGCVTVVAAKPAARVLAVHPTRSNAAGPLVILAVQEFGAGRSAAFTCDTTWRWYLPLRAMRADSPYERFWGQLVRWLAGADTKIRRAAPSVVMRLDRQYVRLGQSVRITAAVRDESGRTPELAGVSCRIERAGTGEPVRTISLSYDAGSGLFEGEFAPQREGRLLLTVSAAGEPTAKLGEDRMTLTVARRSAETDRLARNDALLRELAEKTGGRFADIAALPDLLDQVISHGASVTGPAAQPAVLKLYNFPALLVVFVGLVTLEWALRRTWQLH